MLELKSLICYCIVRWLEIYITRLQYISMSHFMHILVYFLLLSLSDFSLNSFFSFLCHFLYIPLSGLPASYLLYTLLYTPSLVSTFSLSFLSFSLLYCLSLSYLVFLSLILVPYAFSKTIIPKH